MCLLKESLRLEEKVNGDVDFYCLPRYFFELCCIFAVLFILTYWQGNLPIVAAGIFMPACVHSIWAVSYPHVRVLMHLLPADALVKSNGTGETASFISINLPFRISH